jgi:hypothetical protein
MDIGMPTLSDCRIFGYEFISFTLPILFIKANIPIPVKFIKIFTK